MILADEAYNSLSDEIKSSLKPSDEVDRLRSHANDLIREKKAEEAKRLNSDAEVAEWKAKAKEASLKSGQDDVLKVQSQLDDALVKLGDEQTKYNDLLSQNMIKDKTVEAQKIAGTLTKDSDRASLLTQQIMNRIDIDNGKTIVLDESGNQTVSSVQELANHFKSAYPFLCDGSGATGGGAQGGGGGAASDKSFKDMTLTERAQLANSDPVKYKQLSE